MDAQKYSYEILARFFFRTKALAIVLFTGSGFALGILFYFLVPRPGGYYAPFQEVLAGTTPIVELLIFVSFVILAQEFSRSIFGRGRSDYYYLQQYGLQMPLIAALLVLLTLAFGVLALNLAGLSICAFFAHLSAVEINNVILFEALHCGGTLVIAVFLGTFIGMRLRRVTGYALLLIILIFLSGLTTNLIDSFTSSTIAYGLRMVFYGIFIAPFGFVSQIMAPVLDLNYLMPIEPFQWLLPIIWIISVVLGLLLLTFNKRKLALALTPCVFAVLISAWGIYGTTVSLPRMSYAPNDITDRSMADAVSTAGDQYFSKIIPAVANYKMDFTVRDNLSAKVSIVLERPFAGEPVFTLFQGYRVGEVTDLAGRKFAFSQQGDYVTIHTSGQQCNGFVFTYAGTGWGNYSNQQGIFLSGAFPYYPWPGRQQFYRCDDTFGVSVSPAIARRGVVRSIIVTVKSPFAQVFTPEGVVLTPHDKRVFVPTDSLTLMAGQMEKVGDEKTFYCYASKLRFGWNDMDVSKRARAEALEDANIYRCEMALGLDQMSGQSVVLVPTYPRFSNMYDVPVYQQGYVLTSDNQSFEKRHFAAILAMQGIPQDYTKRDIYEGLFTYLADPKLYLKSNLGVKNSVSDDSDAMSYRDNRIADIVRSKGEAYALQHIVAYLMDPSQTESGKVFLSRLSGE